MRRLWNRHKEVLLYIIFGLLTTAVNMAAFALAEWPAKALLGSKNSFWISNPFAWLLAVAFAFVTNKWFVFAQKSWAGRTVARELIPFVGARLLTLAMEQGLMFVFFKLLESRLLVWFLPLWQRFGLPGEAQNAYRFLVKLCVIQALVVALNYGFSKWFIFKKRKEE
jgi:putative flippase GtrA